MHLLITVNAVWNFRRFLAAGLLSDCHRITLLAPRRLGVGPQAAWVPVSAAGDAGEGREVSLKTFRKNKVRTGEMSWIQTEVRS